MFYFDSFNLQKSYMSGRRTSHILLTQSPIQVWLSVSTSLTAEGPYKEYVLNQLSVSQFFNLECSLAFPNLHDFDVLKTVV